MFLGSDSPAEESKSFAIEAAIEDAEDIAEIEI